jgi:hypothetical protein
MGEVNMSAVENSEGRALRAVAEAHATWIKANLSHELVERAVGMNKFSQDVADELFLCQDPENYIVKDKVDRDAIDAAILELQELEAST